MSELPDLVVRDKNGQPLAKAKIDLSRFLVVGGAGEHIRAFNRRGGVLGGEYGPTQWCRVEVMLRIKEVLETALIAGESPRSADNKFNCLKDFISFVDFAELRCSMDSLEHDYLGYAEHLFQKYSKKTRADMRRGYDYVSRLGRLLSQVLDFSARQSLLYRTRWRVPKSVKKSVGKAAEKQNLENTFVFGGFLICLIESLTPQAILGKMPLSVPIRVKGREEFNLILPKSLRANPSDQRGLRSREPVESVVGTRRPILLNIRVAAEFMVFIAQTGMNVAQALELKRAGFKYKPLGDSWRVRAYKRRRGGEVHFEIYKNYKPFLKNYLEFLDRFDSESDRLFPTWDKAGNLSEANPNHLNVLIRAVLDECQVPWIPPSMLRNTRINWLLRRSGDENQTAQMAQHTVEMLQDRYERPSQHLAMTEITHFWKDNDPIKRRDLKGSLIASQCDATPEATEDKPPSVAEPDCLSPSGCFWCKHHRDVDSFDYIWSLVSFRYLKSLESADVVSKEKVPADLVIDRVTEKVRWFEDSSEDRAGWVREAQARLEEGDFHPNWAGLIEFVEEL